MSERKNPRTGRGGDLGRHLFGGARRAVVVVRVGGIFRVFGLGGLGDAGDEALGQLDRALHGAAGIGADFLEGGKGDHEVQDAPSWIAGSDGDGGSCGVVVVICRVHVFLICFGLLCPFTLKSAAGAGGQWEWSSEGTTVFAPRWHSAVKGEDD